MFAETVRRNLLQIADAYAAAKGITRGTVSKKFYGRGNLLDEIIRGHKSTSLDKLDSMLEDFRAKWPQGAKWPKLRAVRMDRRSH